MSDTKIKIGDLKLKKLNEISDFFCRQYEKYIKCKGCPLYDFDCLSLKSIEESDFDIEILVPSHLLGDK